ncbi:VWA domain-containing protein [Paenibacillus luteus]|uniref:VWA domain-containing protein n=1 Tax=Paenibacillus luteus TaxID=2545753 RepID=UPI001142B914|nr:VWA domain-containing protein [Paenibacillus luteus]
MGFQANLPWALLLLLPWFFYLIWASKMTVRLRGKRKIVSIAIRGFILLLIIAMIAEIQPYIDKEQRNVVFVADRSASMRADTGAGEWISEAWRSKASKDRGGIISSGLNAAVEKTLTPQPLTVEDGFVFHADVNQQFTDLSQGLQLAAAMLQKDGGGRIVLLSDGAENAGDVRRQARMLANSGISVDVVQLESTVATDAAIEELIVPAALKQGETFTFELAISSTAAGTAQLRLYDDQAELSISELQLEKGDNRFVLQSVALAPGFHRFRAELFMSGDEQSANNTAHAISRVSGPPSVLIVEGSSGTSANIEAALKASVIRYQTILPEQLSVELAEYAAYDSIILNNVSATRIAEKPMDWIAKAVSDYGVGLVMLGGDESFGLGGYFKTPIERALPVYMDLQGKKQIPSLGLVLVIDRSGSMMDGKLELAKEAAMRTVELLRDIDTVGVVAFDSSPWWVVEPTQLSDREAVLDKIQGIQAEGGTEIFSALSRGYEGLAKLDAQRKHMILLTDGQSGMNANYQLITDQMNEQNMTLSTVAVGDGADQQLLKRLADNAKGRYYFTKDQSTLPAIFSRETVMMSRTYIVEQTFTPSIGQAGDWSSLWQNGIPSINAYIATTPKETAEIALWTPDSDPLLARWAYGSGRTVAWTSDLTGKWSGSFVQWSDLPKVFVDWVKWTFPQFESTPYSITTQMDGSAATLHVRSEAGGEGANSGLTVGIQDQAGNNEQKRLMPVAPDEYETRLSITEPGVYLAQIGQSSGSSAIQNGTTAGFVIPYSPEYRITNVNGPTVMKQVAEISGGRVLDAANPAMAFEFDPLSSRQAYDPARVLWMIVLLLWLIDIAIRRLSIPWGSVYKLAVQPFRSKRIVRAQKLAVPNAPTGSLTRLNVRKSEATRFYSGDDRSVNVETLSHTGLKQDLAKNGQSAAVFQNHSVSSDKKPEERAGSRSVKEAPVQESTVESNVTINRLLAAKNKNKR